MVALLKISARVCVRTEGPGTVLVAVPSLIYVAAVDEGTIQLQCVVVTAISATAAKFAVALDSGLLMRARRFRFNTYHDQPACLPAKRKSDNLRDVVGTTILSIPVWCM